MHYSHAKSQRYLKTVNHAFDAGFNQRLTKIDQQSQFLVGKLDMCEYLDRL